MADHIWKKIEPLMIEQRELRKLYDSSVTGIYNKVLAIDILGRLINILDLIRKHNNLLRALCDKALANLESVKNKDVPIQIMAIDSLMHEVHASGVLASHLIKGKDKADILNFLSELSAIRDPKKHDALMIDINNARDALSQVNGPENYSLYGSIPFTSFARVNSAAMRDTKARFAALKIGLGTGIFYNKNILDLGCNSGHMLFEAVSRGFPKCFGIDIHPTVVKIGNQIADYMDFNGVVKLVEGDVGLLSKKFLKEHVGLEKFQVVFCFSVDEYVQDPENFYKNLVNITTEVCYFEPNNSKKVWTVETIKALGFRRVEEIRVPYNLKKGTTRPNFICHI